MSETEVRETELVTGTIESVITKGEGRWQIVVKPDGSQYTKNLWTKSQSHMEAATAKIGQHGGFPCSVSHWTNQDGKPVRSLWLEGIEEGGAQNLPNATVSPPAAAPAAAPRASTDGMTKEEWARKDSAIHKMACIKTAVEALKHTMPSDPSHDDVTKFIERVAVLSGTWHTVVLAVRDDPTGSDLPF